jgi:hypothetical protein
MPAKAAGTGVKQRLRKQQKWPRDAACVQIPASMVKKADKV